MVEAGELTPTAVQAARAVRVGVQRVRRRMRESYDRTELTATQTGLIGRLDRDGPASASELAAAEGVRAQSLVSPIAGLVERALVERHQDPRDGRRQVVSLSVAGKEFLESSRVAGEGWLATALQERLTPDEIATVTTAMALLDRALAEIAPPPAAPGQSPR